ncbi:MAG: hypothetical protein GY868_02655 [Deltaproteobacteria bacterium]|nr:hypothetical protein [Deltaproteobacteria bacterium]
MKPEEFTWQENSRAMYDAVVKAVPAFVRPIIKSKLLRELKGKSDDSMEITETLFMDALKTSTPESKLEKIIPELEKLKTV